MCQLKATQNIIIQSTHSKLSDFKDKVKKCSFHKCGVFFSLQTRIITPMAKLIQTKETYFLGTTEADKHSICFSEN